MWVTAGVPARAQIRALEVGQKHLILSRALFLNLYKIAHSKRRWISGLTSPWALPRLREPTNIIAAVTKYQLFLASAIGLPKDDTGRIELMTASITTVEKIRTEIRALEHELDRREGKEKRRF